MYSKQTVNDSGRSNVFTVGESEEGADIDHIPDSHTYDVHASVPFETQVYGSIFTTVGALHRWVGRMRKRVIGTLFPTVLIMFMLSIYIHQALFSNKRF